MRNLKPKRPINIVVAIDQNGVLGSSTCLGMSWHLPADLRHFKDITMGGSIVMGYRTYEAIGRRLPGRQNIVLSRQDRPVAQGVELAHDADEALQLAADPVYIIGGGQVFDLYLDKVMRLYVTEIAVESEGDIIFTIDPVQWQEVARETHQKDEHNPYDYSFVTYERR
jgi:dihydrofolate reductase